MQCGGSSRSTGSGCNRGIEDEKRSLKADFGIVGLRDGRKRSGLRDFFDGIAVGSDDSCNPLVDFTLT